MVRATLDDGRVVQASPGHRRRMGERWGQFKRGPAGHAVVVRVELVAYGGHRTFDLLRQEDRDLLDGPVRWRTLR